MVNDNGDPKGMRRVLEERAINTARMNADDMRVVLANHRDFQQKKTETYLLSLDYQVLFIPKFYWELNPIDCVWGQAQGLNSNFSLNHLRKILNPALDSAKTATIRKYSKNMREPTWMKTGRNGGRTSGKALQTTQELLLFLTLNIVIIFVALYLIC